jgi:hypothetical protein
VGYNPSSYDRSRTTCLPRWKHRYDWRMERRCLELCWKKERMELSEHRKTFVCPLRAAAPAGEESWRAQLERLEAESIKRRWSRCMALPVSICRMVKTFWDYCATLKVREIYLSNLIGLRSLFTRVSITPLNHTWSSITPWTQSSPSNHDVQMNALIHLCRRARKNVLTIASVKRENILGKLRVIQCRERLFSSIVWVRGPVCKIKSKLEEG